MNLIKCSVPILTLNSGKYLARCLESLRGFEDVFLVDGNSTDDTLEIARQYGIPVYKQVDSDQKEIIINNFTEVRLRSLSFAKNDWIFLLDSDEYLTQGLVEEIGAAVNGENYNHWRAYRVQKKYCIENKTYDYSFNYPNYYLRLFNKKSGVGYKTGKIVHEKMEVPSNVEVVDLKNCVYSEIPKSFFIGVKKDKYQLSLMKKSTFAQGSFKWRGHSLEMSIIYFLRAVKILLKSLVVYFKHGYKRSLPIGPVLRHVRVHCIMSYWRFLQFLYGSRSKKK